MRLHPGDSGLSGAFSIMSSGAPGEAKPEPHALESKFFTESRLMHREVDVVIEGIDKYGSRLFKKIFSLAF
jgi:hypothetical protein